MSETEITSKEMEFTGLELSIQDIASMIKNVEDNIAEYLYERYYLDGNSHADKLKEINNKYKVKIFILQDDTINDTLALDYIQKELENWQTVSRGKAILPYFININIPDDSVLTDETAGLLKPIDKSIHLKHSQSVKDTLRHEMAHLNDLNFYDSVNVKLEASHLKKEFINAGISEEDINYAYENKLEFIAVAAEGDFSKYSEEFKEYLILLGLPQWAFDLPVEKNIKKARL